MHGFIFVQKIIISPAKRVEFDSEGMSYITLRGRWCDVIVLNVHVPEENKNYMKASFYEELQRLSGEFPKCHMNLLLGDFNAQVGREDIFKLTFIGNL